MFWYWYFALWRNKQIPRSEVQRAIQVKQILKHKVTVTQTYWHWGQWNKIYIVSFNIPLYFSISIIPNCLKLSSAAKYHVWDCLISIQGSICILLGQSDPLQFNFHNLALALAISTNVPSIHPSFLASLDEVAWYDSRLVLTHDNSIRLEYVQKSHLLKKKLWFII